MKNLFFILASTFFFSHASAAVKQIRIDGSSTVFPISEAVAEEYQKVNNKVRVVVGSSGTGGGFKKFALGEIDINNASRTIKDTEADAAKKNGITFHAVPVAHDGITIIVNKKNTWVKNITVAELKKIWEPGSKVKTWKDIRAEWPAEKILLYGPGTDSGTFDFFTEAINGKAHASRADFTKSEDDNVLVQGIAGDKNSLGYFGYAYYSENSDKIRAIPVINKGIAVEPSLKTINDESYSPLSRIIYIYVASKAVARAEVNEFVKFYIKNAAKLSQEVGYVALSADKYAKAEQNFDNFVKTQKPIMTKK